jgi:hypothetical protein
VIPGAGRFSRRPALFLNLLSGNSAGFANGDIHAGLHRHRRSLIHIDSHVDAQNRLHALLTDQGIHADHDPVLVDWSYLPAQRQPAGAWPKDVTIEPDWVDVPEGERDASLLFHDRDHGA